MKNLCIIPARGGSKRIPGKNLKSFLGSPIITRVIDAAKRSGIFDEILISTDSKEIADVALKAGAAVPFMRSAENASDTASTASVIAEVLEELKRKNDLPLNVCCLYPTSVFANAERILEGHKLLTENKFDTVISVQAYEHPIQRAFSLNHDKAKMLWPENMFARTQDLAPSYHDAGQFYWMNTERFLANKQLFTGNTGAVIFKIKECQDIDNPEDWELAEIKYRKLYQQ